MSLTLETTSGIVIKDGESRLETGKTSDLNTDKKLSNEKKVYASKESP